MAIPTWTWQNAADRDRPRRSASIAVDRSDRPKAVDSRSESGAAIDPESATDLDLAQLADEFELLANPIRLEILLALRDREEPVRYSDLRDALAIADNGLLNYHLRQLGPYVESADGEYALTRRGERLLRRVTSE